jgi:tetratricopeptide (TPR) repeat protein
MDPMRKVNKRFFLCLLSGLAALTGGVFLLHYFQSGRVKKALLFQVHRAEEQKQPEKVVQYLGRYLDFEPDDLEERVHLAKTLAEDNPVPIPNARERAIYNLETVLARDPDRVDLRCLLTRLAIDVHRWDLARQHLEILEKCEVPDGERERLKARYEEGQEHFAEAEKLYAKHVELAPGQIDSYARRAFLLRGRLQAPARADEVMNQLVAANNRSVEAYLRRWRYRIEFGLVTKDTVDVFGEDVTKALELAPNDVNALLAASEKEWKAERLDAARAYLQKGLEVEGTDYRLYESLAQVEAEAHRLEAAEEALRKGVEATPIKGARLVLLWKLTELLIDEIEQDPAKSSEAERTIKQFVETSPAAGAVDYLNGRLLMTQGKFEEASLLFELARPSLVSPPELVNQLNLHLARCYEQRGDEAAQKAAYERVVVQNPITGVYFKAGGAAKAGLARLALLRRLKSGQLSDVEITRAFAEAGLAKAPFAELQLLSVEYLAALERYEDARAILEDARKKDPKNIEFAVAFALLSASQGKSPEARALLDAADHEFGDRAELRLARMQFLGSFDSTGAAKTLLGLAEGLDKFSTSDQGKLLRGLAEAHQALGNSKEAKQYWNQLAAHPQHRKDARVRLVLLENAMQANDEASAREALAQVRKIDGDQGLLWRYADAKHRLWLKKRGANTNLDEARALLDQVLRIRPDWPAAVLALAELEDLRGDHAHAAELYRQAFAGSRRNPFILGQLMDAGGQRPEQFEQNLRRAVELAEEVPETWVAYIEFVAGRDKTKAEKAIEDARKALKKLPPEQLALVLAACYEAVGKLDLAVENYEQALTKLPKSAAVARLAAGFYLRNGKPDVAQFLLQRIVDRQMDATEDDITWAKSGLALVLSLRQDYKQLPQALKLVGLRVEKNGDFVETEEGALNHSVESLHARARLLAMQTRVQARSMAIAILEDLNRRRAIGPDDQFMLAQLLQGLDQWPKAREILVKLSESAGGNGAYLSYFIHTLIIKGESDEAQRRFTQLETEDPVSPGTLNVGRLVLKAEVLEARQEGDKAVELLLANARRKDAKPDDLLLVVLSLGRQKRIKEALDICEEAWKNCKPEDVGSVCVGLLRVGPTDKSESDRVQKWLLDAIEKHPKNLALHLFLADWYDGRQQYLQEENEYRTVLDADPENVMALNNLAWLLAQRDGKDKPEKAKDAKKLITQAIAKSGPSPQLLDTSAVVNLALKQSDDALADLVRATAEAPKPIHYFHIARAQELANNSQSASEALNQAKKLGLKRHNLHPIEAAACAKLADELDRP